MSADSRKEKNVTLGSVSVSTTPATAGNLVLNTEEVTGVINIAAGKYRVMIYNLGQVQDGDLEEAATIGGQTLEVGGQPIIYDAVYNPNTNEFLTTPAITGNANGARVRIITTE